MPRTREAADILMGMMDNKQTKKKLLYSFTVGATEEHEGQGHLGNVGRGWSSSFGGQGRPC